MRSFATTFLPICLLGFFLVSPAAAGEDPKYGWTISASSTDPYVNQGPFTNSVRELYLWYACNAGDGMLAAEFGVSTGLNILLAVAPAPPFVNVGNFPDIILQSPVCLSAPVLAATLLTLEVVPGAWCFTPSSNGNKVTVDCAQLAWPMQWIGFSSDGSDPCSKGWDDCAAPVSVENPSFGRVKSLYR